MKLIHNATISCLCKETEDTDAVRTALETFLPENHEKEKINLEEEHLKIDEGENLISLKVHLDKERHMKIVVEKLLSNLSASDKQLLQSQDDRVDIKGAFYLRIDKEAFLKNNEMQLVDHGECIHFKFLLAAFPKTREKALLVRDQLLTSYTE